MDTFYEMDPKSNMALTEFINNIRHTSIRDISHFFNSYLIFSVSTLKLAI